MEWILAQAPPVDPSATKLLENGVLSAVIAALLGTLVYVVVKFAQTIQAQNAERAQRDDHFAVEREKDRTLFREEREKDREEFREERDKDRTMFREELAADRTFCTETNQKTRDIILDAMTDMVKQNNTMHRELRTVATVAQTIHSHITKKPPPTEKPVGD